MLASAPQVVVRLCVANLVGSLQHRFHGGQRRIVQGQDRLLFSFVLPLPDVQRLCFEVDVLAAKVFDLDAAH